MALTIKLMYFLIFQACYKFLGFFVKIRHTTFSVILVVLSLGDPMPDHVTVKAFINLNQWWVRLE